MGPFIRGAVAALVARVQVPDEVVARSLLEPAGAMRSTALLGAPPPSPRPTGASVFPDTGAAPQRDRIVRVGQVAALQYREFIHPAWATGRDDLRGKERQSISPLDASSRPALARSDASESLGPADHWLGRSGGLQQLEWLNAERSRCPNEKRQTHDCLAAFDSLDEPRRDLELLGQGFLGHPLLHPKAAHVCPDKAGNRLD